MGAVTLLDGWLPSFDVREYHEIEVAASAERAYAAVRSTDLARSRTVRLLFALRGLPAGRFRVDDFRAIGFELLEETVGVEVVFGGIGHPWSPMGGMVETSPQTFTSFRQRDFAKMAVNFHVQALGDNRSIMSTETRVECTDHHSRRAFARYWRLIGPFSGYIRTRMLDSIKREAEATA